MSDEWRDNGIVSDFENDLFGQDVHSVTNNETGEDRLVVVYGSESVGEAIANGQWKED